MADTRIEFCGVTFKNPLAAASAEPTLNAANMKKCIDAGANDYLTKPLDTDQLLSLMRVWLAK